jgi:septal ring factor EnvC (AmiA/AmiB activator)
MENQTPPQNVEDLPVEKNSAAEQAVPEKETPAEKPYVPARTSRVGRWILILLATLLVGFGAAFFALYLPANQELQQARSDLSAAEEKLTTTTAALEATAAQLKSTTDDLKKASFLQALARVQANVAYARLSLVTRDLLTAQQEVRAASDNLTLLLSLMQDNETSTALKDRMRNIQNLINTDSNKALEELRTLSENLLRLGNR